ncbi:MAG TPA: hypothetical protein VF161_02175 [Steroidobacteraceae bacterium]
MNDLITVSFANLVAMGRKREPASGDEDAEMTTARKAQLERRATMD